MNNENFKKLISKTPSSWKEKAEARLAKPWLQEYSDQIARRLSAMIDDKDTELNQTRIAEKAGVTRQYISKVVKGQENLSLETIWKLSKAISFELITFPPYKYQQKRKFDADMITSGRVIQMHSRIHTTPEISIVESENIKAVGNF
jgi:transcriptional regulator with XRE-family HTH domain